MVTKHPKSSSALTSLSALNKLSLNNIVARVKSQNVTKAKDSISTSDTYYRLYVVFDDQLIASDEIFQKSNYYMSTIQFYSKILIDHRKGNLYLFNSNTVEVIDIVKMEQKSLLTNNIILSSYSMSLGYDQNGNTEIYSAVKDKILVFKGETLNISDSIFNSPKGSLIYYTATDENSNIFFTSSTSVSMYNPLTKKISTYLNNGPLQSKIRVTRDGKTILIGSGYSTIFQYNLDQNNSIIDIISSPTYIDFSEENFLLANTGTTIVSGFTGELYKNFKLQRSLAIDVDGYQKSFFDNRDSLIYSIGSSKNIFIFENKVGYKIVEKIPIRNVPSFIFTYNGNIYSLEKLIDPITNINRLLLERVIL